MLQRYIVLNNRALLLYKNNVAYQAYPEKPTSVIPLPEIARVNVRNNPISHKATNGPNSYTHMFVLEINLHNS